MAAANIATAKMVDSLVCSCVDASQKYEESSGDAIKVNIMEQIKNEEENGSCSYEPHLFGQHWTILLLLAMNAVYLCCVAAGWFLNKTKTRSNHQDSATCTDLCVDDTALDSTVNPPISSAEAATLVTPAQKDEKEAPEEIAAESPSRNRHLGFPRNRLVPRQPPPLALLAAGTKETRDATKTMPGNHHVLVSTPCVPRISPPLSPATDSDFLGALIAPKTQPVYPSDDSSARNIDRAHVEQALGGPITEATDHSGGSAVNSVATAPVIPVGAPGDVLASPLVVASDQGSRHSPLTMEPTVDEWKKSSKKTNKDTGWGWLSSSLAFSPHLLCFRTPESVPDPKDSVTIEKNAKDDEEVDQMDLQDDTSKQAAPSVEKEAVVLCVDPQSSNENSAEAETKATLTNDVTDKQMCEEVVFESPPPVSDSDKRKCAEDAEDAPLRKKIRRTFPLFWEAAKRWGEKEKKHI